ncbi:MAG: hypothetical protein Q8K99_12320 [Actinomycetota bacterium]|nr:hypothetical protein [Actinomycetota bacterium]
MAQQRKPIPRLGARGGWGQYLVGVLVESAFVVALALAALALAALVLLVVR